MPTFGENSTKNLKELDPDLQAVLEEAIKHYDFSIVCGHRGMEDQNQAFKDGFSKVRWPNSMHNKSPSLAADIIPYPSGYSDIGEFFKMITYVYQAASELGIPIEWGGHWKMKDYPHIQLLLY